MNWLNKVKWYYKVIVMVISSFLNTTLPLPPPFNFADISFIATLSTYKLWWWYVITILIITLTDTIFAVITYKLGHEITRFAVRSDKKREQLNNVKTKMENNKWADVWVLIASATPLPYTLTIYACSVIEYKMGKFVVINLVGRAIKYSGLALMFYYGLKIFN